MPLSDQSLPSSFDENADFYNESGLTKVTRKLKKEPLIPLGCLLTVAAFTNAYRAMRRGDHNQVQRMFRARIIAQGFTVAAMVAGGVYFGAERHKERELWKVQQLQKEEEKRMRWIGELEARDAEEKLLQERLARKRSRRAEDAKNATESGAPQTAEAPAPASTPSSGSFLSGWFGGGGSGVKKSEVAAAAAAAAATETAAPEAAEPVPSAKDAPADSKNKKDNGKSALGTLGNLFSKKSAAAGKADESAEK